jgi:beta-lactamase superfamily II metal-dependent hydrolase
LFAFFYTRGERGVFFLTSGSTKKKKKKKLFRSRHRNRHRHFSTQTKFLFLFSQNFSAFSLPTQHTGIQNSNQVYMPMNLLALMGGDNKIPAENDMIKSKKKAKPFQPQQDKIDDGNKFLP